MTKLDSTQGSTEPFQRRSSADVSVNAKNRPSEDVEFDNINGVLDSHVEGHLYGSFTILEKDIGRHLFISHPYATLWI